MHIDLQMIQNMFLLYGGRIVAALLIFFVGRWLAHWFTALFAKVLGKNNVDVTLVRFLEKVSFYALMAAVLVAAAGQLGINTASFLTILGAASLAVGLALKDSLANFASGVMLILFRPFRVGDFVDIGGQSGTVEQISVFTTVLNTPDNQKKILPNGVITGGVITNVTVNPTRRVDLIASISYDDDIRKAKEILEKIINEQELVLKDPKPTIVVAELADSSVNIAVRPWVKTADYWTVYFAVIEQIKLQFDANGLTIPFPQQDMHVHAVHGQQPDDAGHEAAVLS